LAIESPPLTSPRTTVFLLNVNMFSDQTVYERCPKCTNVFFARVGVISIGQTGR
jgi:hypothetical protein